MSSFTLISECTKIYVGCGFDNIGRTLPFSWFHGREHSSSLIRRQILSRFTGIYSHKWSVYRVVQKKRYPSFNNAITSVNVHRL